MGNPLIKASYRMLHTRVATMLVALFLICFAGGLLAATVSSKALFLLFALPFVAQAVIFLGVRFSPAFCGLVAHPNRAEGRKLHAFTLGFGSSVAAGILLFLALA